MTVKKLSKALGTLDAYHFFDSGAIIAMGLCAILPVLFLPHMSDRGSAVLTVWSQTIFFISFYFWERICIIYDPSYPFSLSRKAGSQGAELYAVSNRKAIEAAAVLPTDRSAVVKAYQIKRMAVSLIMTVGLAAHGLIFIGRDTLCGGVSVLINIIANIPAYAAGYILLTYKRGLVSGGGRIFCCSFGNAVSVSCLNIFFIGKYSECSGRTLGTVMLAGAAVTAAVSFICFAKCLKDAENTARNGETTGGT